MTFKTELISFAHTFIAVFGVALLSNLQTFEWTNLSQETLIAFGIAVARSLVKGLSLYFTAKLKA